VFWKNYINLGAYDDRQTWHGKCLKNIIGRVRIHPDKTKPSVRRRGKRWVFLRRYPSCGRIKLPGEADSFLLMFVPFSPGKKNISSAFGAIYEMGSSEGVDMEPSKGKEKSLLKAFFGESVAWR